jgi:hypothetical protein
MKMQAAHERKAQEHDVGVLIFPTDQDLSIQRTRRELERPFSIEDFPIYLPVNAVEYSAQ